MDKPTKELLDLVDVTPLPRPQKQHRVVYPNGVVHIYSEEFIESLNRVKRLIHPLEEILQITANRVDVNVQDAYFLTELVFMLPTVRIAFVFSLYGSLFTPVLEYDTHSDEMLFRNRLAEAISHIQSHGYVYVSGSDLAEPYTGDNPRFKGKSWWDRFFDYM